MWLKVIKHSKPSVFPMPDNFHMIKTSETWNHKFVQVEIYFCAINLIVSTNVRRYG